MVDYEKAIKRPFTDFKKLLIGILLDIFPIINFFAIGYKIECARTTMKNKFNLPEWENWGKLFKNGFLTMLIGFLYFLPIIIILIIAMINLFASIITSQAILNTNRMMEIILSSLITMWPVLLITLLMLVLVLYLAPIAVMRFAEKGKFGSAFEFSMIFKKAFKTEYLAVWLIVVIITILINIITIIPFIGRAIGSFIGGVIAFSLFGEIYKKL